VKPIIALVFKIFFPFVEPRSALLCSHKVAIDPYPEPDESNLCTKSEYFHNNIYKFSSYLIENIKTNQSVNAV
jgi:hypothetical protein